MLAVLEGERQALAGLDLDALIHATGEKQSICSELENLAPTDVDGECRSLLENVRRQNEVNRKVRNLLSANVAARLEVLTQSAGLYSAPKMQGA